MTLPPLLNRAIVNFNSFDVMAATNSNDSMFEEQRAEEQNQRLIQNNTFSNATSQLVQISNNNTNNNNNDINFQLSDGFDGTGQPAASFAESDLATPAIPHDLTVEAVMPGIYFTKNFIAWNEENLRAHGFTHIIIIDKHIQELYYPSPVFKLATLNKNNELYDATSPFDYFCNAPTPPVAALNFSKEFEAIDLNFGEKSYLTTVLPNCYRAVRFISKALQSGGTILVIDCNGGDQKCLTIIVAYLMYKFNISFKNAFARLKEFYKKADLDRFYVSQLYEYEPILQVQRAQSRGHSCSRELHASILKRKKAADEEFYYDETGCGVSEDGANFIIADTSTKNAFLQNLNPLSHFNATMAQQPQQQQQCSYQQQQQQQRTDQFQHTAKQQMSTVTEFQRCNTYSKQKEFHNIETVNSYNQATAACDDYAME